MSPRWFLFLFAVCVVHSVEIESEIGESGGTVSEVSADFEEEDAGRTEEPPAEERWKKIETRIKEIIQKFIRDSYRDGIRLAYDAELSVDCMGSLTMVMKGLSELNSDTIRLLDAWGKISPGFTTGSVAQLGDYDLCLGLTVRDSNKEPKFHGQYCSLAMNPPLPPRPDVITNDLVLFNTSGFADDTAVKDFMDAAWGFYVTKPRFAICVPDQCSMEDIEKLLRAVEDKYGADLSLLSCEVKEDFHWNTSQIIAIIILGCFAAVVLTSTCLEGVFFYLQLCGKCANKPGPWQRGFLSLSIHKTTGNLFRVGGDSQQRQHFKFFNGLRVLCVFWVIAFHIYTYPSIVTLRSLREFQNNAERFFFQFVNNPGLAVDTFFFISGFLVLHSQRRISKTTPWLRHYVVSMLQRYWRLVPLALLVMLGVFLLPPLSSGPVWKELMSKETENCVQRWWTIPAVFNNHYHFDDTCLVHYWYVSADLQVYAIALAMSILAFRKPATAVALMLSAVVISMIGVAVQTYVNGYHPTVLFFSRDVRFTLNMNRWVALVPSTHIGPYIVGSLTASAYHYHYNKRIHPLVQSFLWLTALTLSGLSLFPTMRWGLGDVPSPEVTVAFAAIHRVAWALGLSWYVFACATGRGGILNTLLSWNALVPLGRLSYAIYLVHAYLVFLKVYTVRQLLDATNFNMVSSVISTMVLSTMCAYLVHVILECPLNLLRSSFEKWVKRKASSRASFSVPSSLDVHTKPSVELQVTRNNENTVS
ncbi:nose resistant to fluoxetine protein 6-like [Ornithodoros turicata]|uniref:nose resistant to fluoxetine protein 6-like n=1 Tax=Ornithodoros turicata TaxID=34597 RepID=UPI0031388B30